MTHIDKPWGGEDIIEQNGDYVVKRLFMKAGHRCSLQYHNLKHETFYVLSGKLKFTVGDSEDALAEHILYPNSFYIIKPGVVHRMEGVEDSYYLECSTNHLDDVVRLKDNYGRTGEIQGPTDDKRNR